MILPFLTVAAAFVLLCGDQIKMGVEGRGVWAAEPAHPAIIRLPVLVEGNGVTAGPTRWQLVVPEHHPALRVSSKVKKAPQLSGSHLGKPTAWEEASWFMHDLQDKGVAKRLTWQVHLHT